MSSEKDIILLGYSGHAYVAIEVLILNGYNIIGYLEKKENSGNPFNLKYLGFERDEATLQKIKGLKIFPAIGENKIRKGIIDFLEGKGFRSQTIIHPRAILSGYESIGDGCLVCKGVNINPLAEIGKGVILNTGCIIEHECKIEDFAHIAPGAVLSGNVKVGEGSFIGANAVVKQGIKIGKNSIIGAGSVVLKDVPDEATYVGNPANRLLK